MEDKKATPATVEDIKALIDKVNKNPAILNWETHFKYLNSIFEKPSSEYTLKDLKLAKTRCLRVIRALKLSKLNNDSARVEHLENFTDLLKDIESVIDYREEKDSIDSKYSKDTNYDIRLEYNDPSKFPGDLEYLTEQLKIINIDKDGNMHAIGSYQAPLIGWFLAIRELGRLKRLKTEYYDAYVKKILEFSFEMPNEMTMVRNNIMSREDNLTPKQEKAYKDAIKWLKGIE